MNALLTTDDVIDALGGTSSVGRIVSRRPQAVYNWRGRARGKFPPETYLVLMAALKQHKLTAPASLWGMDAANQKVAS